MPTIKLKKPGEGDRKRRKSNYGPGGRAVGGAARAARLKKPLPSVKTLAAVDDDLPEPGGHPSGMTAKAKELGFEETPNNPFAAALDTPMNNSGSLIDMIKKPKEIVRQGKTPEQRRALVAQMRDRAPMLRERPEGDSDDTERDGPNADQDGEPSAPASEPSGEAAGSGHGAGPDESEPGAAGTGRPADGLTQEVLQSHEGDPGSADRGDPGQDGVAQSGSEDGAAPTDAEHEGDDQSTEEPPADPASPGQEVLDGAAEPPNAFARAAQGGNRQLQVIGQDRTNNGERAHKKSMSTAYSTEQEEAIAGILAVPGVICNVCPAAENCPEYKENATCAYEEDLQALSSRNLSNVIPAMETLADLQTTRARRAAMIEARVTGGQLDPNVTRQIDTAMRAVEQVARLKGAFQQGSKQSVTVIAQSNNDGHQGGGILDKLFSGLASRKTGEGTIGLNNPAPEEPLTLDAEATVVIKAESEPVPGEALKETTP